MLHALSVLTSSGPVERTDSIGRQSLGYGRQDSPTAGGDILYLGVTRREMPMACVVPQCLTLAIR